MYIIRGQIPSKSNCYKIVSHVDPKTKKVFSSLAKQEVLKKYEDNFYIQCPERGRMVTEDNADIFRSAFRNHCSGLEERSEKEEESKYVFS